MKQLYLFSLCCMALVLGGCSDTPEEMVDGLHEVTLSVRAEEPDTRNGFDAAGKFYWSANDQVGVTTTSIPDEFSMLKLATGAGTSSGEFKGSIFGDVAGYAVYPFSNNHSLMNTVLTYDFPAAYQYSRVDTDFFSTKGTGNSFNAPMWGKITPSGGVTMKHLGGVFCIKLGELPVGEHLTLTLSSMNKMNGQYTVDLMDEIPTLKAVGSEKAEEKKVTISFSNTKARTSGVFYIPVPVGEYRKLRLVVSDGTTDFVNTPLGTMQINRRSLKKIELKSENTPDPDPTPDPGTQQSIEFPHNKVPEFLFGFEGGTQLLTFKAAEAWTLEVKPADGTDWLSVSQLKGDKGSFSLDVTATENQVDPLNPREAEIVLHCWEDVIPIKVFQAQKDALVVAKPSYEIGKQGGEIEVTVGHNIDFDIQIDADWITQKPTRTYVEEKMVFVVAENTTFDSRVGTIIFTSKDGKIKHKGTILQGVYYEFSKEGGVLDIPVDLIGNYEIIVPKPWMHLQQQNADSFQLLIDANNENREGGRLGQIHVRSKDKTKVVKINIFQKGFDNTVRILACGTEYTPQEALAVTRVDNIQTADGISNLVNLTSVYCEGGTLQTMDLTGCLNLTELNCLSCQLRILDLSNCIQLKTFNYAGNPLETLNLSNCSQLPAELKLTRTKSLVTLNLSGCSQLTELDCGGNQLSSLDLSGCSQLTRLWCNDNKLPSLDLSGCRQLSDLLCYNNHLWSLDLLDCWQLTILNCNSNQMTNLDLSGCSQLTGLDCRNNQLSSLDLSGCSQLVRLYCDNNKLTNLDLSGCSQLTELRCENNHLLCLNLSGCSQLVRLYCDNNKLTNLDLSGCSQFTELRCNYNQLTSLDLSGCSQLGLLYCWYNQLTNLNLSGCSQLTALKFEGNPLETLNLSGCSQLTGLDCVRYNLKNLDLSGCNRLTFLNCSGNQLRILDLSSCSQLTTLYCAGNQLPSLDLSGCSQLKKLDCSDNQLPSLDLSGCSQLTELYCYNNQLPSLDISKNTKMNRLNIQMNGLLETLYVWQGFDWYSLNRNSFKDSNTQIIEKTN